MKISARNQFQGTVSAIEAGAVNDEVELTLAGGDKLVAVVTRGSVRQLGLAVGKAVVAVVKAPWVMVAVEDGDVRFSARNQLRGQVSAVRPGAVNSEVAITLPGGSQVHAVVTNDAVTELGLAVGKAATALIKSSHVVLGVPA